VPLSKTEFFSILLKPTTEILGLDEAESRMTPVWLWCGVLNRGELNAGFFAYGSE
jgi:hypothetical protein